MRVVIGLIVLTFSWAAGATDVAAAAASWRGTDLDWSVAKTFLDNKKCRSSKEYFLSCVNAVDAAAKELSPPLQLSLENGSLRLGPRPPEAAISDLKTAVEDALRSRRERHAKIESLDPVAVDFDFESALRKVLQMKPSSMPDQMILGAAISAHLATFDPHAYLRPTVQFTANDLPHLGIGATLLTTQTGAAIEDLLDGGPAREAGLREGDVIVWVERGGRRVDLRLQTFDDLADMIASAENSDLRLQVKRGNEDLQITLRPAVIQVANVTGRILSYEKTTGYIRVRRFATNDTCGPLRTELTRLTNLGASRFILDFRGNPGGSLYEALCVGSLFAGLDNLVGTQYTPVKIPEKNLIHVFDDSPETVWYSGSNLAHDPPPLAILIDANSASAAEVVAGALELRGLAWLVGQRSFGKGSVQTVEQMAGHPSLTLVATSARYYFANRKSNQGVGLEPNFTVPPHATENDPSSYAEREPEVFPSSVNDYVEEPWSDTARAAQVARIQDCVHTQNPNLAQADADYQIAYSAAVLSCDKPASAQKRP